jgi:hypothetical protein
VVALVAELLGVCVMLADEAGDIVRGVAAGGHLGQVRDKSDKSGKSGTISSSSSANPPVPVAEPRKESAGAKALDPQTQADRRAERLISAALFRR